MANYHNVFLDRVHGCLGLRGHLFYVAILLIWLVAIPIKNSIYEVSTAILVILFLVDVLLLGRAREFLDSLEVSKRFLVPFFLIMLSMALANVGAMVGGGYWSADAWWAITEFFYRYALILAVLVFFASSGRFSVGWFIVGVMLSAWVQIVGGGIDILQHQAVLNTLIRSNYWPRLIGLAREPNALGLFAGLYGLVFGLALLRSRQESNCKVFSPFLVLSLLCSLVLLVLSYSRSAWLAFIGASFVVLLHVSPGRFSWRKVLLLSLPVLGVCVAAYWGSERFRSIFDMAANSDRLGIWSGMWPLVVERPVLGYGMGVDLAQHYLLKVIDFYGAHNAEMEILFHTGVVGLMAWVWLFVSMLKAVRQKEGWLLAFPVFFLVVNQFGGSPFYGTQGLNALLVFLSFILMSGLAGKASSGRV